MGSATTYLSFVHVAPGLEPLLERELGSLVEQRTRVVAGGVEVRLNLEELTLVCAGSRLAEGVRVRLKSFRATNFADLERGFATLPWKAYLASGSELGVSVVCKKSRLWHSGAVRERLEGVLVGRLQFQVRADDEAEADAPPTRARIFVRLEDDEVQVSIDASGERLHRRGYRKLAARASLRETLASAMLLAVAPGGVPEGVLWDPFCGAGTIVLEALAWARGGLIQGGRDFAFWSWPALREVERGQVEHAVQLRATGLLQPRALRVFGSDVDQRILEAARQNLTSLEALDRGRSASGSAEERDGSGSGGASELPLGERAHFMVGDVLEVAPEIPRGAFVVTNPPYGHRLEATGIVEKIGTLVRRRPDLRPVSVLVGGEVKRRLPGEFRAAFETQNGGMNVALRVLASGS